MTDRELDVAIATARAAAEAILAVKERAQRNPQEKGDDQGPVTEADLAADELIRERLGAAFPDDLVITEETWDGRDIVPEPRTWFVDPLDGTREFVALRDEYAVMIGLAVDEQPELGVVLQPETGRLWAGRVSTGEAFVEDEAGHRTPVDLRGQPRPEVLRLAVSRSHKGRFAEMAADAFGAVVVERGSVGLKVGLIVDGIADAYVSGSHRMKVWDTCGPAAILRAAGGVVASVDGTPLAYRGAAAHGRGLRAMAPTIVERFVAKLDEVRARWDPRTS